MTAKDRFWAKVDVRGPSECWLWTATTCSGGRYGSFYTGGGRSHRRRTTAHRYSFFLAHGWLPEQVDHTDHCNTLCVNPSHLRAATNGQNQQNLLGAKRSSKSGVRGVDWHAGNGRWRATVGHLGRQITVGYFDTIDEANAAAVAKRNELFTHNTEDRRAV